MINHPISNYISAPNFLIPGRKPIGRVRQKRGHNLSRNLQGHWILNEGGGDAVRDLMLSNVSGTVSGATWRNSVRGGILSFDGTNDDVQLSDISELPANARSFGCWFMLRGSSSGLFHALISHYGAGAAGYQILIQDSDNGLFCGIGDGANRSNAKYTVTENVWTHVFCTVDGANMRQYINGVLNDTAAAGSITAPVNILRFGNGSDITTRYFNGYLDDVRIYNRFLEADEIWDIYTDSYQDLEPFESIMSFAPAANNGAAMYHHLQSLGVYA